MPKFNFQQINYLILSLIIFFITFLNLFPNYYAYKNTSPGKSFTGQASWFDPWDINVYQSALKWGQSHKFLLENIYTTEKNSPIFYYPLYTLTGNLFPNISVPLLFNLLSFFTGVLLILVLYKSINLFIKNLKEKYLALILICLGGGLGWIFFPKIQAADLSITGFTFLSSLQRPHEALGVIFYILSLCLFFKFTNNLKLKFFYFALFSSLITIIFYPFYLLSILLIKGVYCFYLYLLNEKKSYFKYIFLETIFLIIVTLFYYFHLQQNPTFSGVINQNLPPPDILKLILGYGVLLPLFFWQLFFRKKDQADWFLIIWIFISFSLSFLPLGFSRFYLRTLFFPLIILIFKSTSFFAEKLKISKNLILLLFLIIIPISFFYITYQRIAEVSKNNRWFYINEEEKEGINFLNLQKENGVLAAYTLGNLLPVYTNKSVYFGHLIQTPRAQDKLNNLTLFYGNYYSEKEAENFLLENNIHYIFYGEDEQKISQYYSNQNLKYTFLKPVFSEGNTQIFKSL